jgi:hypothetical protein
MLKKQSLFDLMIPISTEYLYHLNKNNTIIQENEENNQKIFDYIIYSSNARKKITKQLNNGLFSKKKSNEQKKNMVENLKEKLK